MLPRMRSRLIITVIIIVFVIIIVIVIAIDHRDYVAVIAIMKMLFEFDQDGIRGSKLNVLF